MAKKEIIENLVNKEELEKEIASIMAELPEGNVDRLYEISDVKFEAEDIVKGHVVRIQGDNAVVDVGMKSEGFIPLEEFGDTKPNIGDELDVFVDAVEDEDGLIVLSKRKADRTLTWERIIKTKKEGDVVEGRVTRKIKGGLLVDIGVPVFLPASQVDIRRVVDVADYVGMHISCEIIKIDVERHNIVVSRRRLLEKERERRKKELLETLQVGDVRKGVVKNITDFGAFVDLGGIDGLLHITDMSWGRVNHPSEIVSIDDEIQIKVLDFDRERERISVGLKQLTDNPWLSVAAKYPKGSVIEGDVVNLMPYGVFVKIEDGVEGLVHISEMSWTKQINHPSEMLTVGDKVKVVVLDINENKREISLGIKQTEVNPWMLVEEKYPVNCVVKGTVKNITNYGAFVELEEGIEGLLHVSDMSWTKKITHPSAMVKKGDVIEAVVMSVDPVRKRVALGQKQLSRDPWESEIPSKYMVGDVVKGKVTKLTNFGVFVEIGNDLEGLLHISELSHRKIEKPEEMVGVNDEMHVKIINVDPKDRKIGLSLKAVMLPAEEETRLKERAEKLAIEAKNKPVEKPAEAAAPEAAPADNPKGEKRPPKDGPAEGEAPTA